MHIYFHVLYLCKYCVCMFVEILTPLVLEAQRQFNFSHIVIGAGAFGKVSTYELLF